MCEAVADEEASHFQGPENDSTSTKAQSSLPQTSAQLPQHQPIAARSLKMEQYNAGPADTFPGHAPNLHKKITTSIATLTPELHESDFRTVEYQYSRDCCRYLLSLLTTKQEENKQIRHQQRALLLETARLDQRNGEMAKSQARIAEAKGITEQRETSEDFVIESKLEVFRMTRAEPVVYALEVFEEVMGVVCENAAREEAMGVLRGQKDVLERKGEEKVLGRKGKRGKRGNSLVVD